MMVVKPVFLTLLVVLVTTAHVKTHDTYISPTTPCTSNYISEDCMTLQQYTYQQNLNHYTQSSRLFILPGSHHLDRVMSFHISNVYFHMIGFETNSTAIANISCVNNAHFEFQNAVIVQFEGLTLVNCVGNKFSTVETITFTDLTFFDWRANTARNLIIRKSNIEMKNCHFRNLTAGALLAEDKTHLNITRSTFMDNIRESMIIINHSRATIASSNFTRNHVINKSSIIVVVNYSNATISTSTFNSNLALYGEIGGAISIINNNIVVVNSSNFTNNFAGHGAAMYVNGSSTLTVVHSNFIDNSAGDGAAIFTNQKSTLTIDQSKFENNYSKGNAGAIGLYESSSATIRRSNFTGNTAKHSGGVFNVMSFSRLSLNNIDYKDDWGLTNFRENSAVLGAVFYASNSVIECSGHNQLNASLNIAEQGVIYALQSTIIFSTETILNFTNNTGSFSLFNSNVTISGKAFFSNNSPQKNRLEEGGAITAFDSEVMLDGDIHFTNNQADNGGAISALRESKISILNGNTEISYNNAELGGGIYAYQSEVLVDYYGNINIKGNTANGRGGGIHAISSIISLSEGVLSLVDNNAKLGGGVSLDLNSKLLIIKKYAIQHQYDKNIVFRNNSASIGGAIYIADETTSATCAADTESWLANQECFLQEFASVSLDPSFPGRIYFRNIYFDSNRADRASILYGGLLDRCSVNPFIDDFNFTAIPRGIDYFLNITNAVNIVDSISSDPVRICFCKENQPNCSYEHPIISVPKGHPLYISLVAVDQVDHPISHDSTVIHASLMNISEHSGINGGQNRQYTNSTGSCTQLQYNIFSSKSSEQLVLYAEGPCSNKGISKRIVNITFSPCNCSFGFQPSPDKFNCSCNCDSKIKPYVTNCFSNNNTLLRKDAAWIKHSVSTGSRLDDFIVHSHCPRDYCRSLTDFFVYINLNTSNGSDAQCDLNRTRLLCGACSDGYSLALGSSKCIKCSSYWLALLIPFGIAGIALVAFILMCNMTVSSGTVNGLIFYANIIAANRTTFLDLSHNKPNILLVFVAWLNLDLGIETCFYNGMDSYAKAWLQIVFPAYIILLVVAIVVISNYSQRFANLIGHKNPIATLATLFLLSFSKLLRIIITALSVTSLTYLYKNSVKAVWLVDANISYFQGKHIPLFLAALLIIIISLLYTSVLLFWQGLLRCSHRRVFKWVNNTKLLSLMDAYHAPYRPKHRYWTGLLLLVRIILYLISSFNVFGDPSLNLISLSIFLICLLGLKVICSTVYRNWALDTLNTSFLLNLCLLTIGTLYTHAYKLENAQLILAHTSISISFATFLGILLYHTYTLFIKGNMSRCNVLSGVRNNTTRRWDFQLFHRNVALKDEEMPLSDNISLTSNDGSVEDCELREPLRGISIEPPTENDYDQLEEAQRRQRELDMKPKEPITHTIVEGPHH